MEGPKQNQNGSSRIRCSFSALAIPAVIAGLLIVVGGGYFAYQRFVEKKTALAPVNSFEDCVKAGYPVAGGIIPRFCVTPDGRRFVEKTDESDRVCTDEAKLCSDGSSVGRVPPSCEFAKCPGENGAAIDTSTWKTYRNEKYGFEMKYPPAWRLEFEAYMPEAAYIVNWREEEERPIGGLLRNQAKVDVLVHHGVSLEQFRAGTECEEYEEAFFRELSIGGRRGLKLVCLSSTGSYPPEGASYLFEKGEDVISFSLVTAGSVTSRDYVALFEAMIASLTFFK